MDEGRLAGNPRPTKGQGFSYLTEDHVIAVGNALRMCGDRPVEGEDLPPWQNLAKVVERPPASQAKLENTAGSVCDQPRRLIKQEPLRR